MCRDSHELPACTELRAGPLTARFEPALAQFRDISWRGTEVLRAIYGAVRDRNWDTILPQTRAVRIATTEEGFEVEFECECRRREIDFFWRATVRGNSIGALEFTFDGRAASTFLKNRIGLCVLHPAEAAGAYTRVLHTNGKVSEGRLPEQISPHQPFLEIRSIMHQAAPGLFAEVSFSGETFEMEDQRNWIDASFKTYSTPLALPFPVEIRAGERVRQTVSLQVREEGAAVPPPRNGRHDTVRIKLENGPPATLPEWGAVCAAEAPALTAAEAHSLRAAGLSHLRVDLRLEGGWRALLQRAAEDSRKLRAPLAPAVTLPAARPEQACGEFAVALWQEKVPVARVTVFHEQEKSTSRRWLELARSALRRQGITAPAGSGTDAYFTEINRERPPVEVSQFISFSVNPQVHAFDDRSLVETLPILAVVLESARAFTAGLPLAVSPVTFKPRFNPNATAAGEATAGGLPESVDPRQSKLFGAAWTLGALKYLALGGARWADFFETTGWKGWLESPAGSPAPELFSSSPGTTFPLYHALRAAADFRGGRVLRAGSSAPWRVEALLLEKNGRRRLALANFEPGPVVVLCPEELMLGTPRARFLDDRTSETAAREPAGFWASPTASLGGAGGRVAVPLLPNGLAFLDSALDP